MQMTRKNKEYDDDWSARIDDHKEDWGRNDDDDDGNEDEGRGSDEYDDNKGSDDNDGRGNDDDDDGSGSDDGDDGSGSDDGDSRGRNDNDGRENEWLTGDGPDFEAEVPGSNPVSPSMLQRSAAGLLWYYSISKSQSGQGELPQLQKIVMMW